MMNETHARMVPGGKDHEMRWFCVVITQFPRCYSMRYRSKLLCTADFRRVNSTIDDKQNTKVHVVQARAMETSATGLQQARAWTDPMLVQCRNTFILHFLAFAVGRGRWY